MNTGDTPFQATALGNSLTVKDIDRSIAWYRDTLGFTVDQQFEHEGKVVGARVTAGNVGLILNRDDGGRGWDRVKGEGFSLYFTTDQDIDAIGARVKRAGHKLDVEPADMPWGVRFVGLTDPDGFKIGIAKPL